MTATISKTSAAAIRALAEKHGNITAEIVLKAAAKKNSPLHPFFDWDDTSAAQRFRLVQAAHLIRRIKVEYAITETHSVRIRAFHNVSDPEPTAEGEEPASRYFVPLETALSVENYRDQLLEQCKRDMAAFRQKYAALSEVSGVIAAMKDFAA